MRHIIGESCQHRSMSTAALWTCETSIHNSNSKMCSDDRSIGWLKSDCANEFAFLKLYRPVFSKLLQIQYVTANRPFHVTVWHIVWHASCRTLRTTYRCASGSTNVTFLHRQTHISVNHRYYFIVLCVSKVVVSHSVSVSSCMFLYASSEEMWRRMSINNNNNSTVCV